jgi:hypothetical protein
VKSLVGPGKGDWAFLTKPKLFHEKKPKSNISAKSELLKSLGATSNKENTCAALRLPSFGDEVSIVEVASQGVMIMAIVAGNGEHMVLVP